MTFWPPVSTKARVLWLAGYVVVAAIGVWITRSQEQRSEQEKQATATTPAPSSTQPSQPVVPTETKLPPKAEPTRAMVATHAPAPETFGEYVALHPSRRNAIVLALTRMAPVFNDAGYRVRFIYPGQHAGAGAHKAALYLKMLFGESGVRLGMGSSVFNPEDLRSEIICSRQSESFAKTISHAIAPMIDLPVTVSKRDEETDLAIFVFEPLYFTREGQVRLKRD